MVPEMELQKPRITEIKVRMDCNGCVQKIKKALHGITGIYDIYIDFPQQKITIIGWAEPEKIVKAIKKTRKTAVICLHAEQSDQPPEQMTEPPSEGGPTEGAPPQPESETPPAEPPQTEAAPPPEAQKEPQKTVNLSSEPNPSPESANDSGNHPSQPSKPNDVEEIHVIYHHPPDYGYRYNYGHTYDHNFQPGFPRQWNAYPNGPGSYPGGPGSRGEPSSPPQLPPEPVYVGSQPPPQPVYMSPRPPPQPVHVSPHPPPQPVYVSPRPPPQPVHVSPQPQPQPVYVTHSYNTYKPSPYVTEYAYPRSPPRYPQPPPSYSPPRYSYYTRPDYYSQDYYNANNGSNNITSMFSEENPNACRIV